MERKIEKTIDIENVDIDSKFDLRCREAAGEIAPMERELRKP